MAVTIPNTLVTGQVIDPAELNENFTTLSAAFDNLTNANLSGSAGITNANLANSKHEIGVGISSRGGQWVAAVHAAGQYCGFCIVPYDSTAGVQTYTIKTVEWYMECQSALITTSPQFKLWKGNDTDGWTEITNGAIAPGLVTATGRATIQNATLVTNATRPQVFALELDVLAVGSTNIDYFHCGIKLTQSLRS